MMISNGDVLIILDCCHTGAALRRQDDPEDRTADLVAASGAKETTYSKESSFTKKIDLTAQLLAKAGPFTVRSLLRTLRGVRPETAPLDVINLSAPTNSGPPSNLFIRDSRNLPYHRFHSHCSSQASYYLSLTYRVVNPFNFIQFGAQWIAQSSFNAIWLSGNQFDWI
jgi:hypothetical protein